MKTSIKYCNSFKWISCWVTGLMVKVSQFIARPYAKNLASSQGYILIGIPLQKMQYVNWNAFDSLNADHSENEFSCLINIGSCGLHIIHGTFKTSFQSFEWNLQKILKAMWRFFLDSPARRDIYVRINSSSGFPLRFCVTRWVEGEQVTARAVTLWLKVVNVIQHFLSLTKSIRPKNNKSYDTLVKHDIDSSMFVKTQFFKDIASVLQPYSIQNQNDAPLVTFICDEMVQLFTKIMRFLTK